MTALTTVDHQCQGSYSNYQPYDKQSAALPTYPLRHLATDTHTHRRRDTQTHKHTVTILPTHLSSNEGCVGRSQGPVERSVTVHVFWGVLQHSLSHVVVLRVGIIIIIISGHNKPWLIVICHFLVTIRKYSIHPAIYYIYRVSNKKCPTQIVKRCHLWWKNFATKGLI